MNYLLNFIKEHEDWETRIKDKKVYVKKDGDLALFKYILADNPDFTDPVVKECRGIIIDMKNMKVVCRPFDKFGNYGESYADSIDWSTARVQEKLDGSIIKLYYYKNLWWLATNGIPNAFDVENMQGYNFGELAFDTLVGWQGLDYKDLDPEYTYIFELTSPNNQIVVPYAETTMWHIGTRHNESGQEVIVDIGMPKPKEYPLSTLDECIEFAKTFSANEHEGFVVVDGGWHRVKVKSPDYIAAHHLKNNSVLNRKKMIELIYDCEDGEYLNYFPEKAEAFNKVRDDINHLKRLINNYCDKVAEAAAQGIARREYAINNRNDEFFSFAVQKVYGGKDIVISKSYLIDKLAKEENEAMKKMFIKINTITDAVEFVKVAATVEGDITCSKGRLYVDGKSALGIFSIDTSNGITVEYPADAEDFENYISKFKSVEV